MKNHITDEQIQELVVKNIEYQKADNKVAELWDKVKRVLPTDMKEELSNLDDAIVQRTAEEARINYKCGFKNGANFIMNIKSNEV